MVNPKVLPSERRVAPQLRLFGKNMRHLDQDEDPLYQSAFATGSPAGGGGGGSSPSSPPPGGVFDAPRRAHSPLTPPSPHLLPSTPWPGLPRW
eukprot:COSAG01_NODE_2050_length_8556_cov_63.294312_7_plen_93_part_00